jgi:excisionase family DNA binding protein
VSVAGPPFDDRASLERQDKEFLTVDELARLLRVPKATIYRWRTTGNGPRGHKIGRYVRFRRAELESWLEEHADDPGPAHS